MSAATPEWKPGMTLAVGDTVMYDGSMFVVIQSHTTQADWTPRTATQSLYRRVQPEGSTEWQPDTDYATGSECTYEGSAYTCLQGHTSQAGWEAPERSFPVETQDRIRRIMQHEQFPSGTACASVWQRSAV